MRLFCVLLLPLAACGGGGAVPPPPPGDPTDTEAACTGPAPEHAAPCPGTDAGLAGDAPRTVIGPAGACGAVPCSYACEEGFRFVAGLCVAPPPPPIEGRFAREADGTVRDTVTGRRWLAAPGCLETLGGLVRPASGVGFHEAKGWAGRLGHGACGLSDGSVPGAWRLPSADELSTLEGVLGTPDDPFQGPPRGLAWTDLEPCTTSAIAIDPFTGLIEEHAKAAALQVWPVR